MLKAVKNIAYVSALIVGSQLANVLAYEYVVQPIQKKIDSKKAKKA